MIIIMENCKAPTPWIKAMNKRNTAHIMYIETENVIQNFTNS